MSRKRTKTDIEAAPDRGLIYLALAFAVAAALAVIIPSPSHILF